MRSGEVQSPSWLAIVLGIVPFAAMCFSIPLWDRIYPFVFGLPFNLFWLTLWIVLSSGCMTVADRIERKRGSNEKP